MPHKEFVLPIWPRIIRSSYLAGLASSSTGISLLPRIVAAGVPLVQSRILLEPMLGDCIMQILKICMVNQKANAELLGQTMCQL